MTDTMRSNDIGRHGLGRLPAEDSRDVQFRMVAPALTDPPDYKYYSTGPILDQGPYPHCVGFAWRQWLSSSLMKTKTGPKPEVIYAEAQKIDEWPGENYAGTSVRAGAKYLQSLGHIATYLWAWDVATLKGWILSGQGTVVVGTMWFDGMFTPDAQGYIHPTGPEAGGHAYLLAGFSQERDAFRIVNSWGRGWGESGRAWISSADMSTLLSNNGEAATAVEQKVTV